MPTASDATNTSIPLSGSLKDFACRALVSIVVANKKETLVRIFETVKKKYQFYLAVNLHKQQHTLIQFELQSFS